MKPLVVDHAPDSIRLVTELVPHDLEPGRHRLGVHLVDDSASRPVHAPTLVIRGHRPGPVVGLTAAIHGNELNGIPTIHDLFASVEPEEVCGTLVGVTIANVIGYLRHQRTFTDGSDLNRIMPGSPHGSEGQVYAHRLLERLLLRFDYLIDLHTASFGRVNSLYVRANMKHAQTARLARAIGPEIIVHNEGGDGTLRAAIAQRGIPSITVEIGDPQIIDERFVKASRIGIRDVLELLGVLPEDGEKAAANAIECSGSDWLYTDAGGLLDIRPALTERVKAGDVVATLSDPWGQPLKTYRSPVDGVVVGKSTNPVCRTGSRILHLGFEGSV